MEIGPMRALKLIDEILTEEIEALSEEDLVLLLEHKEVCIRKILPILAFEITQVKAGEEWNSGKLHWSLRLVAFFEEPRAFDWIIQLHKFPEVLDYEDEILFITLHWADILAATGAGEWERLKEEIEDEECDDDIKEACLKTLVVLVAQGKLDRSVAIEYFHSLYLKILAGDLHDPYMVSSLVEVSVDLWPGESLEEIKEVFGLGFIDDELLDLSEVLEVYAQGKEAALEHLSNWVFDTHILFPLVDDEEFLGEDFSFGSGDEEEDFDDEDSEEDEEDFEEEDEDFDDEDEDSDEESEGVSEDDLLPCPELETLSAKEQKKYRSLERLCEESPVEVVEFTSETIRKHPHIPALYHYLYKALINLELNVEAMTILRDLIRLFPNDLLGKISYAMYLLRRGETEKVAALFSNTWDLSALYPGRAFHVVECRQFALLMGSYYLKMGDLENAKEAAVLLATLDPFSSECLLLTDKIENEEYGRSFDEESEEE